VGIAEKVSKVMESKVKVTRRRRPHISRELDFVREREPLKGFEPKAT